MDSISVSSRKMTKVRPVNKSVHERSRDSAFLPLPQRPTTRQLWVFNVIPDLDRESSHFLFSAFFYRHDSGGVFSKKRVSTYRKIRTRNEQACHCLPSCCSKATPDSRYERRQKCEPDFSHSNWQWKDKITSQILRSMLRTITCGLSIMEAIKYIILILIRLHLLVIELSTDIQLQS